MTADPMTAPTPAQAPQLPAVVASRGLNRAAGLLAAAVLADSAVEHYRGSFENPAMVAPLAAAGLALAASGHGARDGRPDAHAARDAVHVLGALTGAVGGGFHLYNVAKRPGGVSWSNLFYGAPLGAPFALVLSGVLGIMAERVRAGGAGGRLRVLGVPAGRAMASVAAAGLAGTAAEAWLLHFRGAFHNPAMLAPVTVPPVAAGLLARAALRGRGGRSTRRWLVATAVLGVAGVGLHLFGVGRGMGGWRNWSQNLLDGPPIPAPPSFTALALAGLAALDLMDGRADG